MYSRKAHFQEPTDTVFTSVYSRCTLYLQKQARKRPIKRKAGVAAKPMRDGRERLHIDGNLFHDPCTFQSLLSTVQYTCISQLHRSSTSAMLWALAHTYCCCTVYRHAWRTQVPYLQYMCALSMPLFIGHYHQSQPISAAPVDGACGPAVAISGRFVCGAATARPVAAATAKFIASAAASRLSRTAT